MAETNERGSVDPVNSVGQADSVHGVGPSAPTEQEPHPPRLPSAHIVARVHDGTELIVRQWRSSDLDTYHRAIHESYVHLQPWMPWALAEPQEIDAHAEILQRFSGRWTHDNVVYGIFLDARAVGGTGLHNRIGESGWEIGYWIHADFEGRGFVSAVVQALTDEAFVDASVDRVEIRCDAANLRSSAVPVRLGYAMVGHEARVPVAAAETTLGTVYRLVRANWPGANAGGSHSGDASTLRSS